MKTIVSLLLFVSSLLFAEMNATEGTYVNTNDVTYIQEQQEKADKKRNEQLNIHLQNLKTIEFEVLKEKVWMKSYASYLTSLDVRQSLEKIKDRIDFLQINAKSLVETDELNALISKEKILASQVEKLKEKDTAPFSQLLTPPPIDEIPAISNPFDIFTGISLVKTLNTNYEDYIKRKEQLTVLIKLLQEENNIYMILKPLDIEKKYFDDYQYKKKQLERFKTALDTIHVTSEVYQKRLEVIEININKSVEKQVYGLVNIGIIILVIFFVFFLMKQVVKKYITDNERFYMANKIITFINVTLVILILFFSYIENVSYIVTILGFASAGIAIAMKDWFMSILGWLVIVFGGSIHVGDRIRVDMDGIKYVGDVMDISLLRMTLLEDITLTTVRENRRAGRIIFIPNNYVFTRMIANYSHSSLKTVWDGIDVTITF